jgi:hypothetical protein
VIGLELVFHGARSYSLKDQRGEHNAVGAAHAGAWLGLPQHGDLMTQDEQLGVLRCRGPAKKDEPSCELGEDQVQQARMQWPTLGTPQGDLAAQAVSRRQPAPAARAPAGPVDSGFTGHAEETAASIRAHTGHDAHACEPGGSAS